MAKRATPTTDDRSPRHAREDDVSVETRAASLTFFCGCARMSSLVRGSHSVSVSVTQPRSLVVGAPSLASLILNG